ncbi:MAG: hypothetical protein ABIP97_09220 [Chthoniobacterales bacterium]
MKHSLTLILTMLCSIGLLHAKDYAFIDQLPKKLAQAMLQSQPGWDSGVTSEMNEATSQYNEALVAIIKDLANQYYPKDTFDKAALNDYLKSLYTVRRFKQIAANPSGEDHGTAASLDVPTEVSTDLENTISDMVQAITTDDPKFNYAKWKKHWERTQRQ